MTRARTHLVLTGAARRRVFGDYQPTTPSRFLAEIPSELVEQAPGPITMAHQPSLGSRFEYRPNPYGRGGRGKVRDEPAPFAYEDEDQSSSDVRPGARVRHAQFGVGTVLTVEPLDGDARVVVRFAIGQKTLRARFARLEVV
jgi:DNA helicase-2/ATP-dependent DNA helicase PcrA